MGTIIGLIKPNKAAYKAFITCYIVLLISSDLTIDLPSFT